MAKRKEGEFIPYGRGLVESVSKMVWPKDRDPAEVLSEMMCGDAHDSLVEAHEIANDQLNFDAATIIQKAIEILAFESYSFAGKAIPTVVNQTKMKLDFTNKKPAFIAFITKFVQKVGAILSTTDSTIVFVVEEKKAETIITKFLDVKGVTLTNQGKAQSYCGLCDNCQKKVGDCPALIDSGNRPTRLEALRRDMVCPENYEPIDTQKSVFV